MIEQMFDNGQDGRPVTAAQRSPRTTQPNRRSARLMWVIALPTPHPVRRLALELLMRAAAIALAAVVILGLLPAIAEAVG